MKRYHLSPEAEQDLDDIKAYLTEKCSIRVARYVLHEIQNSLWFLGETPEAGHYREDLTDEAVKFWPVFSYLIVYDPISQPLAIVRVLHGRRDVAALLNEND